MINPVNFKGAVPIKQDIETNTTTTPNFKGNESNSLEKNPENDSFEKENHTVRNIAIGMVVALGLAAAADGIFNHGKYLKRIFSKAETAAKESAEGAKPNTGNAASKAEESVKKGTEGTKAKPEPKTQKTADSKGESESKLQGTPEQKPEQKGKTITKAKNTPKTNTEPKVKVESEQKTKAKQEQKPTVDTEVSSNTVADKKAPLKDKSESNIGKLGAASAAGVVGFGLCNNASTEETTLNNELFEPIQNNEVELVTDNWVEAQKEQEEKRRKQKEDEDLLMASVIATDLINNESDNNFGYNDSFNNDYMSNENGYFSSDTYSSDSFAADDFTSDSFFSDGDLF